MNITPEMKAQLEEQKKQCVYCKIVSKEIPGKVVFEDDVTEATIDIYPVLKGHTVFFFKEHYPIMPYIPPEEFKHYFGLLPELCKSIKDGIVVTGVNIFMANGGVAGQQFPHVLAHIFPRENDDGFFNFLFKKGGSLAEKEADMLANNLPIMMKNHFTRNPASWHLGDGSVPSFLENIHNKCKVIYEDEKVLCVLPEVSAVPGHIEIYSKEEEKYIEKLSQESSAHLFFAASFAATAVFEGLGAHGTNLILKSGEADDNPGGRLVVHILPRKQDDGLQSMMWQPKQPEYDLDAVAGKIKDKTWKIKYQEKEIKEEKKEVPKEKSEVKIEPVKPSSGQEEIIEAIKSMQK